MADAPTQPWSAAGATHEFAAFVSNTTYDDLPSEVVEAVKHVILDTLAVAVTGADSVATMALADLVRANGTAPTATVLANTLRADPASAAWINGTTAHALDYDDYCFAMSGHPSVTLLPPILALAEARGRSGRDVITAYAVGFEAAIMLSHTVNPDHYGHGWHGTGTVGAVGATCAASNLIGLSFDQTRNAIAIGGSSVAGLRQNFGTDVKPFHAGNAARAGVVAVELASRGYEGSEQFLEGEMGFFNVFTPGPHGERQKPAFDFGSPWRTLTPGITTKMFPSCGSTHASIGGALDLRDQGLRVDQIERIDIDLTDISADNLQFPRPSTGLEAKFSLQYCVARALSAGVVGLDDFTDEAVNDGTMDSLIGRIHKHRSDQLTEEYVWGTPRPAVLTVRLTNGETIVHRADSPPGSPANFSQDRLNDKVRDCIARGSIVGSADDVITGVGKLEDCDDITALLAPLVGH